MTDHAPSRPVIRLRPKVKSRVRFGFPWIYADELVLDRRSRSHAPGTIVTLEDAERRPLGTATINPNSKIVARLLDGDPTASIDLDWIAARLTRAEALRTHLFDAPCYRLVHAEADGMPGVVIDRFDDIAVVQPNAAWADVLFPLIEEALIARFGARAVIKNASGRARALEGLNDVSAVTVGSVEGPVPVPMNGATYMADLLEGQKTGLFFDQRPNHALAAQLARGGSVLDVFSHVGGFALAALAAGATEALSVDGSAAALALAEEGARRGGIADRFSTRKGDAFAVMQALTEQGATFGTVICDPPAFAPQKPALDAGLRAYERVARLGAGLVAPGGYLVLCSCSHAADLPRFREASLRGVSKAGRSAQLIATGGAGPDHPVHPALTESAYLKALFLRLI